MRKLILMMLLVIVGNSAMAVEPAAVSINAEKGWVYIGTDKIDKIKVYANPSTIRRTGNMAKIWVMYDFVKARTDGSLTYLSFKDHIEVDCKKEKARILNEVTYAGNMGGGKGMTTNSPPDNWGSIRQHTAVEKVWRIACAKK